MCVCVVLRSLLSSLPFIHSCSILLFSPLRIHSSLELASTRKKEEPLSGKHEFELKARTVLFGQMGKSVGFYVELPSESEVSFPNLKITVFMLLSLMDSICRHFSFTINCIFRVMPGVNRGFKVV